MAILLINPGSKVKTWASSYQVMPLGLGYIAACLEEKGLPVVVWDLNVNPLPEALFINKIKKLKPTVVGLTATTTMVKTAWRLAELIKNQSQAKVVLGGPHASALPKESAHLDQIDFVIRNEGEVTFLKLAQALLNKKPYRQIKGITFKKGNRIIHNPPRPFIQNLDSLPLPARHLFPMQSYRPSQPLLSMKTPCANILTSRGCPFGCNFCFKGVFGRTFRVRSVESILNEWEILLKKYRVKEIEIVDDNFALDVARAIHFCEEIIKRKLTVSWATFSGVRVDHPHYQRLTRLMKRAGCYRVSFGVESGSDKVLERINKQTSAKQIIKAVKTANQVGLLTMASCIIGNAGESRQTMRQTINFAKKLDADIGQFTVCTPYPGSPLREEVIQKGKLLINDWDKYDNMANRAFFEMEEVKKKDVEEMRQKAYREFYLRPKVMFGLFKNMVHHPAMIKYLTPKIIDLLKNWKQ